MYTSKQAKRVQAEQGVLGSMLIDPNCVPNVLNKLSPDDFSIQRNREIFLSIRSLSQQATSVDAVMVLHNLRKMGHWDEPSARSYLHQMMLETPSSAEVDRYIATLLSPLEEPSGDFHGKAGNGEPSGGKPPPNPRPPT